MLVNKECPNVMFQDKNHDGKGEFTEKASLIIILSILSAQDYCYVKEYLCADPLLLVLYTLQYWRQNKNVRSECFTMNHPFSGWSMVFLKNALDDKTQKI